jgi:hypothetical protein
MKAKHRHLFRHIFSKHCITTCTHMTDSFFHHELNFRICTTAMRIHNKISSPPCNKNTAAAHKQHCEDICGFPRIHTPTHQGANHTCMCKRRNMHAQLVPQQMTDTWRYSKHVHRDHIRIPTTCQPQQHTEHHRGTCLLARTLRNRAHNHTHQLSTTTSSRPCTNTTTRRTMIGRLRRPLHRGLRAPCGLSKVPWKK